jgi:hypothetical protein
VAEPLPFFPSSLLLFAGCLPFHGVVACWEALGPFFVSLNCSPSLTIFPHRRFEVSASCA